MLLPDEFRQRRRTHPRRQRPGRLQIGLFLGLKQTLVGVVVSHPLHYTRPSRIRRNYSATPAKPARKKMRVRDKPSRVKLGCF